MTRVISPDIVRIEVNRVYVVSLQIVSVPNAVDVGGDDPLAVGFTTEDPCRYFDVSAGLGGVRLVDEFDDWLASAVVRRDSFAADVVVERPNVAIGSVLGITER